MKCGMLITHLISNENVNLVNPLFTYIMNMKIRILEYLNTCCFVVSATGGGMEQHLYLTVHYCCVDTFCLVGYTV